MKEGYPCKFQAINKVNIEFKGFVKNKESAYIQRTDTKNKNKIKAHTKRNRYKFIKL